MDDIKSCSYGASGRMGQAVALAVIADDTAELEGPCCSTRQCTRALIVNRCSAMTRRVL